MIQHKTFLNVADNSGVKLVKCVKILNGHKKKYGCISDIIVIVVKNLKSNLNLLNLKKKLLFKSVIVQTKQFYFSKTGLKFKFVSNFVVLLDKQLNPLGTRLLGFVPDRLKPILFKLKTLSLKIF